MSNSHSIYDMLKQESDPEVRLQGIRLAKEMEDLSFLMQPPASPAVWECCAEILAEKPDAVLAPYLEDLLKWLQDLNWPGAVTILGRLKRFSGETLKEPFMCCFHFAVNSDAEEDRMWLGYLSLLLANSQLKKELPQTVVEKLQNCQAEEE